MGLLIKLFDWLLLLFLVAHGAAIVLFDAQVLFPDIYPQELKDFVKNTAEEMQDPFGTPTKPAWYMVVTYLEVYFKLPILLLTIPAFLIQSARFNYVRIPCIMFAVESLTTIFMMTAELVMVDYTKLDYGPKTLEKVNGMLAIYVPFIVFSGLMLLRAWLTPNMWPKKVKSLKTQ